MSNRLVLTSRRGLHNNVVQISRITNFIGVALVSIGIGHDYAVSPELQPEFMVIRLCVATIGAAALILMFTPWGKVNVKTITFCWILVPQVMLAYMIMETGGFSSSYARGLVFVLIAAALFPILTFCQSMIVVAGSIVLYLGAASYGSHGTLIVGEARGASMHITTLLLICALARLFLERTFFTLNRYEEELKSTLAFVEKKLEELAHQKAVAVHQDKMTSLANVIASMLNTVNHPVNSGLWALDTALRGPSIQKSPDLIDPLIDVEKALTSIKRSMAGLRQFSTPKGMEVPHNAVDCDFQELVKSTIELMGNELQRTRVITKVSPGHRVRSHCHAKCSYGYRHKREGSVDDKQARAPPNCH
jgi:two-component system, sensor histidine kinase PhcS